MKIEIEKGKRIGNIKLVCPPMSLTNKSQPMSSTNLDEDLSVNDTNDTSFRTDDSISGVSAGAGAADFTSPTHVPGHIRNDPRASFGAASRPSSEHGRTSPSADNTARLFRSLGLEDEDDAFSVDSKPAASSISNDRIKMNMTKTNPQELYHMICPEVISHDNNLFAVISLKIPPAYVDSVSLEVLPCGRKAKMTLEVPPVFQQPEYILGAQVSSAMSVLHAAVVAALSQQKSTAEAKVKHKLVLNLPFQAEPGTSDALLGAGTGQNVGYLKIAKASQALQFTGNVFFVFKKIQNNFKSSSAASCILFDANSGNFHNPETRRVPPPARRGAGPPGNPSNENDAGADVHMESASGPPSATNSRRRARVSNLEDVDQERPTSFVAFEVSRIEQEGGD